MNEVPLAPLVVVLVLLAYLFKLFKRRQERESTPVDRPSDGKVTKAILAANGMVCDYADYILKFPLGGDEIRDVSCLPHAKDLLLAAHRIELARETGKERRAALQVGALGLAQFQ